MNAKKWFCLLLALAMLLSCAAWAEPDDESEAVVATDDGWTGNLTWDDDPTPAADDDSTPAEDDGWDDDLGEVTDASGDEEVAPGAGLAVHDTSYEPGPGAWRPDQDTLDAEAQAITQWAMSLLGVDVVISTGDESGEGDEDQEAITISIDQILANIDQEQEDWFLMLVNSEHPIPSSWKVGKLVEVRGGEKVSKRISQPLQDMFDAARKAGYNPRVNSGYRTKTKQQSLFNAKVKQFKKDGLTEAEAKAKAAEWVALPGTSEHEAGIGIDITAKSGSKDKLFKWLSENSWKYGFILRYPEDKIEYTGISYEPWHFRYVGLRAAAEMYATGKCLEEYLGLSPRIKIENGFIETPETITLPIGNNLQIDVTDEIEATPDDNALYLPDGDDGLVP